MSRRCVGWFCSETGANALSEGGHWLVLGLCVHRYHKRRHNARTISSYSVPCSTRADLMALLGGLVKSDATSISALFPGSTLTLAGQIHRTLPGTMGPPKRRATACWASSTFKLVASIMYIHIHKHTYIHAYEARSCFKRYCT
jgi:hypothetical protein